jgi:hypothetical protein
MASRKLTPSELLEIDSTVLIVTLPIALAGFAWLIVAGAWNDWRARK